MESDLWLTIAVVVRLWILVHGRYRGANAAPQRCGYYPRLLRADPI